MKYPLRSPYLKFKRTDKDEYVIENWLYNEAYSVSRRLASFLRRLNGRRNPYKLMPGYSKEEIDQILDDLWDCSLLAPKKAAISLGTGSFIYPVMYCYPGKKKRIIAGIFNSLLLVSFIPMLLMGIYQYHQADYFAMHNWGEMFLGMAVGILVGITLHELSHAAAGLSLGAHVSEVGIGTHFFLPSAYVLMDTRDVTSRFRNAQINAAGVEMNMLLYGVFMSLAVSGPENSFVLYMAAAVNLGVGIVNALPLKGLDGMHVLSNILGEEDLLKCAVRTVKKHRKRSCKTGNKAEHVAAVTASYALIGFQVVLPLLMIYEWYNVVALVRMIL